MDLYVLQFIQNECLNTGQFMKTGCFVSLTLSGFIFKIMRGLSSLGPVAATGWPERENEGDDAGLASAQRPAPEHARVWDHQHAHPDPLLPA